MLVVAVACTLLMRAKVEEIENKKLLHQQHRKYGLIRCKKYSY